MLPANTRCNKRGFLRFQQFLLVWIIGFAGIVGAADDSFIEEATRKVRNEAELRQIIDTPPPIGESLQTLYKYYENREAAAKQLGLHEVALKNAQEWLDAMPPEMQFQPRWQLWGHHRKYGDRDLALKYGEATIVAATNKINRARSLFQLAGDYLDQYETKRARALTDEGESALNDHLSQSRGRHVNFGVERGRSELLTLRSALARFDGKFAEAERFALASIEPALAAISVSKGLRPRQQQGAYGSYVGAVSATRKAHTDLGKIYEAEMLLREAIDYLRNENRLAPFYGGLMRQAAHLRINQGRFKDAARLAHASLRDIEENSSDINAQNVWTRLALLSATIGLERWNEAQKIVAALESETAKSPSLRKLLDNQPRGVVRLMNGEIAEALTLLKRSNNFNLERYGTDHYFSAQASGLYAAALLQKAQAEKNIAAEDSARHMLATAVHAMVEPKGLQAGTENAGLRKLYRRLVFEAYLDALYPAMQKGDEASIVEGFRIADNLRGSSVQQAVVDAAIRAVANMPGLGELIRQMQDGQRETVLLYDHIARQMDEAPERRNQQMVTQMRNRLLTLEKQHADLLASIRQRFPEFDQLARPAAPEAKMVAKYLGPQEAMLSILLVRSRTYLWLVTDAGIRFASSESGREQVSAQIANLRKTLDVASQDSPPAVDAKAAYALYKTLVGPVRSLAGKREQWTIAAGGVLGTLPFSALLTRPANTQKPATAPWLVRELATAATPSVAAWVALRQMPRSFGTRKVLVAFGDPDFGGGLKVASGLVRKLPTERQESKPDTIEAYASLGASRFNYQSIPPLPETRDELLAIAKALSADKDRDLHFGKNASRNTVLRLNEAKELAQRQVVMFATHGLIPGDLPGLGQPAIALAYAGKGMEDSLLTLEDVLGLHLDADWIVLSACNTAASDGQSSEAISGLGRGFFYAGARALLLTHWAVESESAKMLTIATFTGYAANPATPRAQVLRQAQLTLLANPETAHPVYWAPFTLIGDGTR
ncbi:MAG: hypothetical protein A2520_10855 [Deltaproteobacteria bacterium RIFOXYD12_FULL_53_23]|nr:MAG: hypothetical protein A2520_10855 [Deltaproteobacteria bacterium RIFOXYD12_FULL_53_23]